MTRRDDLGALLEHRQRRRVRGDRVRRRRRAGFVLATVLVGIGGAIMLVGFGANAALSYDCTLSSLQATRIGENSFIYAADGTLLGSIPADRNREPVPIEEMSSWLPTATVAIEDRRFYEHGGVDWEGIARAAYRDYKAGKTVEGGSTITQQLVRNLYTGREQTWHRKLKEACLAIKLNSTESKTEILTDYLNTVYYGNHAYGVEAAAQTYFSKHAQNLTLPQAALLAGLPQAPSVDDPFHDPQAAIARRDEVLAAMLTNGDITQSEYDSASHAAMHLNPGKVFTHIRQPYFFSYVLQLLEDKYGATTVREGGLRIYTTIEPRLQRAANSAIRQTLYEPDDPAAAVVSVEPGTGAIRAMTAVIPGNTTNQFNLVAQSRRQAGSTFKSFVLASAIERGMDPDHTYYTSAPFVCTTGPWCAGDYAAGNPWEVSTYSHSYLGTISVTSATLASDNTVYAQLTLDVGPRYVFNMARRLGVEMTPDTPVASIGLGSLAVSPLDMAAAYATFASGGIYAKPMAITKVVFPDGTNDAAAGWGVPQTKRVLSQGVAWKVNDVLAQNALYGTGAGSGDGVHPNAGKTGTTDDHADAWFDGYTRDLATSVWMGYPGGEIPMTDVHGYSVAGATFPVPIWHLYMETAEAPFKARDFLLPDHYPAYRPFTHQYFGYLAYQTTSATTTTTTTATTTATTTTATTTTTPPPSTAGGQVEQTGGHAQP